jgi:hypothetical protein
VPFSASAGCRGRRNHHRDQRGQGSICRRRCRSRRVQRRYSPRCNVCHSPARCSGGPPRNRRSDVARRSRGTGPPLGEMRPCGCSAAVATPNADERRISSRDPRHQRSRHRRRLTTPADDVTPDVDGVTKMLISINGSVFAVDSFTRPAARTRGMPFVAGSAHARDRRIMTSDFLAGPDRIAYLVMVLLAQRSSDVRKLVAGSLLLQPLAPKLSYVCSRMRPARLASRPYRDGYVRSPGRRAGRKTHLVRGIERRSACRCRT